MSLASFAAKNAVPSTEPKLLTLHRPAIRNQKTLIWLQHQTATVTWSKWDAVVTSLMDYQYWRNRKATPTGEPLVNIVGLIITHLPSKTDVQEFLADLFTISHNVSIILLSHAVLSLKSEAYWVDNYDNLIVLDTMHESYPFLRPWDGTQKDAVALLAHLCRYHRLVDCPLSAERSAVYRQVGITVATNVQPEQIWLIGQYFRHKNKERAQEIKECLALNCANPHIDKIVQLTEQDWSKDWRGLTGATKIQQCVTGQRLTYAHFLQFVHDEVPANTYVILANSDIYLGDSLTNLWSMNLKGLMLALLRWDDTVTSWLGSKELRGTAERQQAVLFGPRADSQDTWILFSDSIKDVTWKYAAFQFQLGQAGCDNAFAGLMLQNGFALSNPALTFRTYHLHNTGIRDYSTANTIRRPLYINLVPSYIIDTEQQQTPDQFTCMCNELVEFEVRSSSMSNEITYCTMVGKEGRYQWEPSVENHYFEPAIPVYSWGNKGTGHTAGYAAGHATGYAITAHGLVYDPYRIYVGKKVDNYPYWRDTTVNIFTPMRFVAGRLLAVPMTAEFAALVFGHPALYALHYVARCLRLLQEKPEPRPTLWLPRGFQPWAMEANTIEYDPTIAYWTEEVTGFVPGALEFGREDIAGLRSLVSDWIHVPTRRVCCVVCDAHGVINDEWIARVLTPFFAANDAMWVLRIIRPEDTMMNYQPLLGASMCVFLGGPKQHLRWATLWALPKYCCVVEFQQELELDGEFQHLAHVCDFKSWVLLLSRGSVTDVREQMLLGLKKWLVKNEDELVA